MYHSAPLTAGELRQLAAANRQSRQLAELHVAIISRLEDLLELEDAELRSGVRNMIEYLTQKPTQH